MPDNINDMRLDSVPMVQAQLFDMLTELDRELTRRGSQYFLAYGTALGAVREKSLIPWDTDIDVAIPWNTYDHASRALSKGLSPQYSLVGTATDPDYPYLFSRIVRRDMGDEIVHVDLFPLVGTSSNALLRTLHIAVGRLVCRLYWAKKRPRQLKGKTRGLKRLRVAFAEFTLAPIPARTLRACFRFLATLWDATSATYWLNLAGSYGSREGLPKKFYGDGASATLYGRQFPVPSMVQEYLRAIYGEFMRRPEAATIDNYHRTFQREAVPLLGQNLVVTDPDSTRRVIACASNSKKDIHP